MYLKNLIGKRIIFRQKWWGTLYEAKVLEVSPSGEYVKLKTKYPTGEREEWVETDSCVVLEVLDE